MPTSKPVAEAFSRAVARQDEVLLPTDRVEHGFFIYRAAK